MKSKDHNCPAGRFNFNNHDTLSFSRQNPLYLVYFQHLHHSSLSQQHQSEPAAGRPHCQQQYRFYIKNLISQTSGKFLSQYSTKTKNHVVCNLS